MFDLNSINNFVLVFFFLFSVCFFLFIFSIWILILFFCKHANKINTIMAPLIFSIFSTSIFFSVFFFLLSRGYCFCCSYSIEYIFFFFFFFCLSRLLNLLFSDFAESQHIRCQAVYRVINRCFILKFCLYISFSVCMCLLLNICEVLGW